MHRSPIVLLFCIHVCAVIEKNPAPVRPRGARISDDCCSGVNPRLPRESTPAPRLDEQAHDTLPSLDAYAKPESGLLGTIPKVNRSTAMPELVNIRTRSRYCSPLLDAACSGLQPLFKFVFCNMDICASLDQEAYSVELPATGWRVYWRLSRFVPSVDIGATV